MKNSTLTLLLLMSILYACAPSVEQAIKYNDDIIAKNEAIQAKLNVLTDSYDKFIPEEMDKAYAEALKSTQEGIEFINKLEAFDKDTSFKAGALSLFKTYQSILEVEHKRLIELLKLPSSQYGEAQVAEYDKLREEANKKPDIEVNKLTEIQANFAKKFKFEITQE